MTDIQRARDVLAKWREGSSSGPWGIDPDSDYNDVGILADGDYICASPDDGVRGGHLNADAALIVGTAGNPALLDAIDELLDLEAAVAERGGPVFANTQRIAAAIIAADERMSA